MAFRISEEEWEALFDEPHHLFKLYASIRRVMDYRTGIAGQRRRISEPMLYEVLAEGHVQGRNNRGQWPTREKVRSAIRRLEKLGLLSRIGRLVFYLPKADVRETASEVNNQRTTILNIHKSDAYRMRERKNNPPPGQVYIHTSNGADHYRSRQKQPPAERIANAGKEYLANKYGEINSNIIQGEFGE